MMLRRARRSDAEALSRNNVLLAGESENVHLRRATVRSGVRKLLADPRKGFYLVAVDKGDVIGQLMITFEWSDWRDSNMWWVQSVYVKRGFRRRGVFRALFREAGRRAGRRGVKVLRLYVHARNRKAIDVYRRVGMRRMHYLFFQLSA